ncbi:MAG: 6-phosphofructokinase, partial [Candidatus Limnocylindria bacterium]
MTRIGILTGGGDVPGLNSIIKSVVYRGWEIGWETIGIRRGWMGLTHLGPAGASDGELVLELNRDNTRRIDRSGGTILHTSRTNPARMKRDGLPDGLDPNRLAGLQVAEDRYDLTPVVLENIKRLGITHLVAIGGDDTLGYADRLSREGVPLVAIPKTMDNDVQGTEYCVGFSTAVTRAKELINRQRTT